MLWRFTIRLFTVGLVLLSLGYLLPIFSILPLTTAFLTGVFIAGLAFAVEIFLLKKEVLPFTQGLITFFLSLGGLSFLKIGFQVDFSWLGLLLAALIIGLVDLIIPTTLK